MAANKKAPILLGICTMAFLYFTLNNITGFDYSVDEPMWVHYSKIQQNHGFILDTKLAPPLPFWINGLSLKITKNNIAPRYASILIFIITLAITYHLLSKLNLSKTKKILFTSALLINPYFILYSRTAMTDIHYFSFIWLSLLSLYIYLQKKQKKHIIYSGLFFSLSALTKHISIIFYPLFLATILGLWKKRKLTKNDTIKFIKYSSIGFIFLGTVNLASIIKTGEIYSFATRLMTIINAIPLIEIATAHTHGTLILDPVTLIMRAIKYLAAVTIYTLPFVLLLIHQKKHQTKKTLALTTNQKYILLIILGMFMTSLFLKEGYMRQLIVIYPAIYLFAIKNTKTKNITKALTIFIIYCLVIDIYAFSLFNTKIFGSSKDFLENTPNTKLQLFEYINNNTDQNDIVITNIYPDIIHAKESILTYNSIINPPQNTKYLIYNPNDIKNKEQKKDIENALKKYHTIEKTFEYKNITEYYIYRINKTTWNKKEKTQPASSALLLSDIIK